MQSNSNSTCLVAMTTMNSRRGWNSQKKKVKDLGLALALNLCPDLPQASKEVNNSKAFTIGRKKILIFSGRATCRCYKARFYQVSREYSKNWLRRINIKWNATLEIEYALNPSNFDAKPWFLHVAAHKVKCPRPFWEIDPDFFTRV